MRLVLLLLAFVSVASSLQCYYGVVPWGKEAKTAGLKLTNCYAQCCKVTWTLPGTIYACGDSECPKPREFVKGEKCAQGQVDASWCHCTGIVGQCKPKLY